jgi:hypothetical protein
MMQAVEKRFGSNGKPPKAIEWLTDNGSYYQVFDAKFDCAGHLMRRRWLCLVHYHRGNGTKSVFNDLTIGRIDMIILRHLEMLP